MAAPLVDCPTHGIVPASIDLFDEMSGLTVSFTHSSADCSICGQESPIIDGSYQGRGGQIHAELRFTPKQWASLQQALLTAQRELDSGMKPKHVERRLRESAAVAGPEAESLLEKVGRPASVGLATWLAVLIALLAYFAPRAAEDEQDPDRQEQIIEDQERIISEYQRLLEEQQRQDSSEPNGPDEQPGR